MLPALRTWLAALLCAGCVTARMTEGNEIPLERLDDLQPGVTTKAEVLQWFGPPESFSDASALQELLVQGEALPEDVIDLPFADAFVFQRTKARLRGWILLLFNWFDVRLASDTLIVFFDADDRVLYWAYRPGTEAVEPAEEAE